MTNLGCASTEGNRHQARALTIDEDFADFSTYRIEGKRKFRVLP